MCVRVAAGRTRRVELGVWTGLERVRSGWSEGRRPRCRVSARRVGGADTDTRTAVGEREGDRS
jgi:hypothetical protein